MKRICMLLSLFSSLCMVKAELPRVMLLIEEKNLGSIPTAEVEATAARMLLLNDVQVVDQDMVKANIKKDQQLLRMAGDPRGAAAVGLQFGADIIIVGDAVCKPAAGRIGGSNLRSYEAVTTLRAIRTDTSTTLASASQIGNAIAINDVSGGSKALQASGTATLDTLLPDMLDAWEKGQSSTDNHRAIDITFGGIDAAWMLRDVRKVMKGNDNISKVVQRQYTPGAAIFEVQTGLEAQALAENLLLNPPDRLRFQILNVSARKMNLRVVKKK